MGCQGDFTTHYWKKDFAAFFALVVLSACAANGEMSFKQKATSMGSKVETAEVSFEDQKVIQISAGEEHNCAVTDIGAVYCWGRNQQSRLGTAEEIQASPFRVIENNALSVATGSSRTCARVWNPEVLTVEVYCWGSGYLGDGLPEGSSLPQKVLGLENVHEIAVAQESTCAVAGESREVFCWGNGALGLGDFVYSRTLPGKVRVGTSPIQNVISISSSNGSFCVLQDQSINQSTNKIYCWGTSYFFIGAVATYFTYSPQQVVLPAETQIVALQNSLASWNGGTYQKCAIDTSGQFWCWGSDDGMLGKSAWMPSNAVTTAAAKKILGNTVIQIFASSQHACGIVDEIDSSGALYCWPRSNYQHHLGQYGQKVPLLWNDEEQDQFSFETPNKVFDSDVLQIALGRDHSCALMTDFTVRCFGSNLYGQLGNGIKGVQAAPSRILASVESDSEIPFKNVVTAGQMGCAISTTDDSVYCWGGHQLDLKGFRKINGLTNPEKIILPDLGLSPSYAYALQDGKLFRWAVNENSAQVVSANESEENSNGAVPIEGLVDVAVSPELVYDYPSSGDALDRGLCGLVLNGGSYTVRCLWRPYSTEFLDVKVFPVYLTLPSTAFNPELLNIGQNFCVRYEVTISGGIAKELHCYDEFRTEVTFGANGPTYAALNPQEIADVSNINIDSDRFWNFFINNELEYCSEMHAGSQTTITCSQYPYSVTASSFIANDLQDFALNRSAVCFLIANEIFCFGNGSSGALGLGSLGFSLDYNPALSIPDQAIPLQFPHGEIATKIQALEEGFCALTNSGKIYCWGSSPVDALGQGIISFDDEP